MIYPKIRVKASRSRTIYQGTWYALAYGKCFRFNTFASALDYALNNCVSHFKWAVRINKNEGLSICHGKIATRAALKAKAHD